VKRRRKLRPRPFTGRFAAERTGARNRSFRRCVLAACDRRGGSFRSVATASAPLEPSGACGSAAAPGSSADAALEAIRRLDQSLDDARLVRGVTRRVDESELGARPTFVQAPSIARGADDVVAAVDDDAWDVRDAIHVVEQLRRRIEESAVREVMTFDAREREGEPRII